MSTRKRSKRSSSSIRRGPSEGARVLRIVYFTGMSVDSMSEEEVSFAVEVGTSLARRLGLPFAGLSRQIAPESERGRVWAEYVPDKREHHRDTCYAGRVDVALAKSAATAFAEIEAMSDTVLVFMGFSNGAIPAYECAKYYTENPPKSSRVATCLLVNGCPAVRSSMLCEDDARRRLGPVSTVMATCESDSLWHSGRALYLSAWILGATVFSFPQNKGRSSHESLPSPRAAYYALMASMRAAAS